MQAQEKFNPPRDFCLELLTWCYINTTNIDLNNEEIDSKAKKEEKKIYISAENNNDYSKKIVHLITSQFKLGIDHLNNIEQEKLILEKYRNFLKEIHNKTLKIGILNINSHESESIFFTEIFKQLNIIANFHTHPAASEFLSTFKEGIINTLINSINEINVKSPPSLKEISSEKVINNSLIFAKFTELVEKNEISSSLAEDLLESSRNVPISFKKLIESKRKESLEKESITNEM